MSCVNETEAGPWCCKHALFSTLLSIEGLANFAGTPQLHHMFVCIHTHVQDILVLY